MDGKRVQYCSVLGDRPELKRSLVKSLMTATQIIDVIACQEMTIRRQTNLPYEIERTFFGQPFSLSQSVCYDHGEEASNLVNNFKVWLSEHEEAQVMLASVLVVIGLWWLVRTILALLINLLCPLMVVLLAVIMVPQLRDPLLGQNYPALANVLSNILTKLEQKADRAHRTRE